METLFIYLLKSSGLLALFFISYHLLLRKETFFNSNRWFLLLGLITSVGLPLLVYTKVVWVTPVASNFDYTTIPLTIVAEQKSIMDYVPLISILLYGFVAMLLAAKLLYDFYNLKKLLKGKASYHQADYRLVDTKENLAPFSFFKTIVYNSELYDAIELENILEHEKVHSDQSHTLDVLISRAFCIIFWFNPFVWLYKKAVLQNLEFIADSEATKKLTDKKAYQITLLKITTQENCDAITNHFYQSLIKKRIVMLNKSQSKKVNSWKYLLVIPALVAFVFMFQIKVVAQEIKKITTNVNEQVIDRTIDKDATDVEIQQLTKLLKEAQDVDLIFSNLKRNAKGEITAIKLTFNDKRGSKGVSEQKGNKPISPVRFVSKKYADGRIEIGFYTEDKKDSASKDNDTVEEIYNTTTTSTETNSSNTSTNNGTTQSQTTSNTTTQLNLEKIDPTNLNGIKTSKTTQTIKIVQSETNGIPTEATYYINGKIATKEEVEKIDPNAIKKTGSNSDNIFTGNKLDKKTQASDDIKDTKRNREQAMQERKQILEDRTRALEVRKKELEDSKKAVEDKENN
ncbi:hypothetical protein HNP99_003385 [Flavobacterium sp. 28A]|uniref:M56 family metallopeptidase n=1 Tax=Flavobacterium sp. 28A TaxID=2735895 RepID=UPI00156ED596|nr:M56 family metallopeptidase [Flavobacterium sp. 28A]NRT17011.1 hypothetical protein [Flavobacterium sp. 28A]